MPILYNIQRGLSGPISQLYVREHQQGPKLFQFLNLRGDK